MVTSGVRPLNDIRVFPDPAAACKAAAENFAELAEANAQDKKPFSVALSGGTTPEKMYHWLAQEPLCSRMDWDNVHFFWGDERFFPHHHPHSNYYMAHKALLSRVPIPEVNIHPVSYKAKTPKLAAEEYEATLQNHFSLKVGQIPEFDLVILGLGRDGHTASLLPRSKALQEENRLVVETEGGEPNLARVTLTYPVLNHAHHIVWLVTGSKKKAVMKRVIEGKGDYHDIPALKVKPLQTTPIWFTDITYSTASSL
jgi:6-phosphogluconolactonase